MRSGIKLVVALAITLFGVSLAFSQVGPAPGIALQDEGTNQGRIQILNCVGAGVVCTKSGVTGTATISGGGGGGGNFVEVEVNFSTGDNTVSTTVTGQTWVSSSSVIVCGPTAFSTSDRADGVDDAAIEQLTCVPHTRVVGTGFTLLANIANGLAQGRFKCHCTGS